MKHEDILPLLKNSKIVLEFSHDDVENRFDKASLLDIINIDPTNNYWLPLIDTAIANYFENNEPKQEEMN